MHLTKSQKKYIKKNLKKIHFSELARKLALPGEELKEYLKSVLSADKYQKYVLDYTQTKTTPVLISGSTTWPGGKKWFKQNWVALLFLTFLVIAVYTNTLNNEFLSDDIAGIMQEKNIGNPFYWLVHQPINFFRYLNYGIVYNLFGLKPPYFRLVNILLHLGSVITIFTIISLLYSQMLALLVSGIFAVHPLLIESVTWISGGIHAQYSFFVLLSFLFYLLARMQNWSKKYYFLSLASFFVALFTTEKSAILPLIILSFEFSFGQIQKTWKKSVPYFLLSGLAATFVFFGGNFISRVTSLQTQYYQEQGLYNPFSQIPTAIASYLWLMLWPDKLTLYHSEMSLSKFQFFLMAFVTCLFLGLLAFFCFKKKYRQYFFWLSFFLISLLPMLTPFKVAWIVAERYVYFGATGIFVLFGLLLQQLDKKVKIKHLSWGVWVVIVIALSVRTIIRNTDWKNQDNLWIAASRTSPSSPQNHNNLGDMYMRHGNLEKAAQEFQIAIQLKPDYGDACHNLANIYRQMGKSNQAEENYLNALKFNPRLWQSYQNLSVIYFEKGMFDQSLEMVKRAIEINPQNPDLHFILGFIHFQTNNKKEAKLELEKVLQLDNNNQKAKELLLKL